MTRGQGCEVNKAVALPAQPKGAGAGTRSERPPGAADPGASGKSGCPEAWKSPVCAGLFGSRPVSRILSRVTIHLCSYPVPRRAASAEPVRLAPDGVWRAAVSPRRWWALTPPFHPYRRRLRRTRRRRFAFCATFRRLSPPPSRERPALWCPDFPRRPACAGRRGHPACRPNSTGAEAASLRPNRVISHSGHRTAGPSCRTNSPHTGHSSEAPRKSAKSSCSSVRCRGAT